MRGSSLSGHRDVGVTPVPRTSREEDREKVCAKKFARRQAGGEGTVIMGKVSLLSSTLDSRPGHPVWGGLLGTVPVEQPPSHCPLHARCSAKGERLTCRNFSFFGISES